MKRLTINVSDEVHEELQRLADEAEIDITTLLKRAVALHRWAWDHRDELLLFGDTKSTGWKRFLERGRREDDE